MYKSPLSQNEGHNTYQTRYKPIATFPYIVTIFTSSELCEIQKGSIALFLPNLGVKRNMPCSVIYDLRALGGRQLMNLIIKQPVKKLQSTVGHMRRQDRIAQFLYATMRDLQLEVGTNVLFFYLNSNIFIHYRQNKVEIHMGNSQ